MSEHHGGNEGDSEVVETHLACESCGSSDAMTEYTDHTYCFSCSKHKWKKNNSKERESTLNTASTSNSNEIELTKGVFGSLKDRGITKDVCKKYGVSCKVRREEDGTHTILKHYYPYTDIEGNVVAQKIRTVADKTQMPWEGSPKQAGFFGMNTIVRRTGKNAKNVITITEGELDAMACYQMFGERYNFVSIPNGAKGALRDCKKNLEWLDKFDEIYICFDNDKEGKSAAKEVAMLFDGRAKIVEFSDGFKDACDYLKAGKTDLFTQAWWAAEFYIPSEILTGDAILDLIDNYEEKECFTLPWKGLDKMTYGYRLGETWAFVAHAKVGKTGGVREIVHHIIHADDRDHKVGTIFLEGPARDHALGFLSLEADIPLHLPDSIYTPKDFQDAKDSLPTDKICFYKREGVIDIDQILGVIRYYIRAMDCKVIVLDNLMSLISDQPTDEERQLLNKTITRVVKLAEDTETWIILVAHLNRQTGMIYGTSLLEKQAYTVIEFDRDLKADTHKERNTTQVSVNYNRFSGDTGLCCELFYEKSTGRMTEQPISEKKNKYKSKHGKKKSKQIESEFENDREYEEPDVD